MLDEIVISTAIVVILFVLSSNTRTENNSINYLQETRQYFSPYGKLSTIKGTIYKSRAETRIAMFLEKNNIKFIYEFPIKKTPFKTDFYLVDHDVYVEYWGLLDLPNRDGEEYRNNHTRKLRIYQTLNLHLISIYPKDLNRLPQIFHDFISSS